MNSKTKKIGFSILTILLITLWIGFRNPVKADGTSAGASTPMIRASIPTPTRSITLSNSILGGSGYVVSPNAVQLTDLNEVYFITGTTTTYGIVALVDCTIILDNVSITSPAIAGIDLNGHNVTIALNTGSNNTLTITGGDPAIHCGLGSTLILNGDGALTVDSSAHPQCAGIGGRVAEDGGTITISENATVTVTGGGQSAGIGGGDEGNGGTVTIKDAATVTATGGNLGGAGIGGGMNSNVTAPGLMGNGGTVTIEGSATVTATGGVNAAGIGGGSYGNGGIVTIKDSATVIAAIPLISAPGVGAGIGNGGGSPIGGTINILGGTVTAEGFTGIGGGSGLVTISGGTISATGSGSVGIGDNNTATVHVTGGTITAQGNNFGNGIDGASVEISGGNLLSNDGVSATPSTSIYSNASALINAYQSKLTVPGITTPQPITAFSTTDGITYSLSGASTITDGGQQVLAVWLPSSTASQTVYVTIGGVNYEASYIRPTSVTNQTLILSAVAPTTVSVTGVTLDKSVVTILENLTETITATVQPVNATDKRVVWSSSDTNIATVDAFGVVIGKKAGTATITATTNDGNHIANCVVTVIATSSSSSSGSSSTSSSTPVTGGTTIPGENTGGTNNSKEFWYPNSSGTTTNSSGADSANGGSVTSPDSPNYNPVTGGDMGGASALIGFFAMATTSSVGFCLRKHKNSP